MFVWLCPNPLTATAEWGRYEGRALRLWSSTAIVAAMPMCHACWAVMCAAQKRKCGFSNEVFKRLQRLDMTARPETLAIFFRRFWRVGLLSLLGFASAAWSAAGW